MAGNEKSQTGNFERDPKNANTEPDIVWHAPTRIYIIECSVPRDANCVTMRNHKVAKYNRLVDDFKALYKKPVSLLPIVIGCTGVVADGVAADLAQLPCDIELAWLQKIVTCETTKMIRRLFTR